MVEGGGTTRMRYSISAGLRVKARIPMDFHLISHRLQRLWRCSHWAELANNDLRMAKNKLRRGLGMWQRIARVFLVRLAVDR